MNAEERIFRENVMKSGKEQRLESSFNSSGSFTQNDLKTKSAKQLDAIDGHIAAIGCRLHMLRSRSKERSFLFL